jgi:hypothetical protein
MIAHASLFEWVFLLVSALVVVEAVANLRTARLDQAVFIGKKIDGGLRSVADVNVQMGWFFVATSVLMFGVSLLSLLLAPPPPDYIDLPQSVVMIVGWILLGLLMVIASMLSKSARHKMMNLSRAEHQETAYITESPAESGHPIDSPIDGAVVHGRRTTDVKLPEKEK